MPLCIMNNGIGAELTMLVDEGGDIIWCAMCRLRLLDGQFLPYTEMFNSTTFLGIPLYPFLIAQKSYYIGTSLRANSLQSYFFTYLYMKHHVQIMVCKLIAGGMWRRKAVLS